MKKNEVKVLQLINSYMTVRFGFLVAVSVAAYAINQITIRSSWRSAPLIKPSENDQESSEKPNTEDDREQFANFNEDVEEEEKEEVKLINGDINAPPSDPSNFGYKSFVEFKNLERDFPPIGNKNETEIKEKVYNNVYETEMANNGSELERLRNLVRELEEREVKLEGELLEYYGVKEQESDILELQKQVRIKTVEIEMMNTTINSLQSEKKKLLEEMSKGASVKKELEVARSKIKELQRQIQLEANQTKIQLLSLKQQVSALQSKEEQAIKKDNEVEKMAKSLKELEVEVVELKRINRELQHEKRKLIVKLSNMTESEMLGKMKEEVYNLKHTNEDLLKQVESLQMNRFSEVEELVYLRWINACLRFEHHNYQMPSGKISARDLNKSLSPKSQEKAKQLQLKYAGSEPGDMDLESNFSYPFSPGSDDIDNTSIDSSMSRYSKKPTLIQKLKKWGKSKDDSSTHSSLSRASSSHKQKGPLEALMLRNADESVAITTFGAVDQDEESQNLPPIRTRVTSNDPMNNTVASSFKLMSKYPSYKDCHKLALERKKEIKEKAEQARTTKFGDALKVKADVETQGEFVESLATEVRAASFEDIEDLVVFVNWLDEELSLVDERAVLKHFDWPEGKVDALREAAFEYQELMKLEKQVSGFVDDPNISCEAALMKMYKLLEKMEESVYALLRTRDMAISGYKEFGIPTNWLQDSGIVGKIMVSSVQLARKYMRRVALELDALEGSDKEPNREFLVLQGIRFAFRVHQIAGGFDVESMKAFEELRSRIHSQMQTGGNN